MRKLKIEWNREREENWKKFIIKRLKGKFKKETHTKGINRRNEETVGKIKECINGCQ